MLKKYIKKMFYSQKDSWFCGEFGEDEDKLIKKRNPWKIINHNFNIFEIKDNLCSAKERDSNLDLYSSTHSTRTNISISF